MSANRRGWWTLVVLGLAGGFLAAFAWQEPGSARRGPGPGDPLPTLGLWLNLTPEQLARCAEVSPGFARERAELETALARERDRLAELFEDRDAADDAILLQVERVIDAHDRLERRVAGYLVALRPLLTDDQRVLLFERCAQGVREASGWRWRHGQRGGGPPGRGPQAGGRRGQGPPWARPAPTTSASTDDDTP